MLRYVTRRIKDSIERTCNALEAHRTWTCGNEGIGDGQNQPSSSSDKNCLTLHSQQSPSNVLFEFGLEPKIPPLAATHLNGGIRQRNVCAFRGKSVLSPGKLKESGSSSSGQEDFRERIHHKHHCSFQKNVLDALTWSSALICGWYTSQILCMRRRRNGWNGHCKYAKMLMQPSHAFHTSVLSHWASTAPEQIRETHKWKFNENLSYLAEDNYEASKFVHNVNGDQLKNDQKNIAEKDILPKTVDDAVHNILHIIGDIEFQLGVESVNSHRYDLAVSHFKLATTHNHANATYNLGICYEEGIGVEKNLKMAFECYMIASSLGHAKALYNVGVFHARGLANLPKNRKAARQYFKEAAKLGLDEANQALGLTSMKKQVRPPCNDEVKRSKFYEFQTQPVAIAI